jgi:hypothetical protein
LEDKIILSCESRFFWKAGYRDEDASYSAYDNERYRVKGFMEGFLKRDHQTTGRRTFFKKVANTEKSQHIWENTRNAM